MRPYVKIKKVAENATYVKYRYGCPEPKYALTIRAADWEKFLEDGAPEGMASIVMEWLTAQMVLAANKTWPDEATITL